MTIFTGEASRSMWDDIAAVKDVKTHDALYALGCHCQYLEETVVALEEKVEWLERGFTALLDAIGKAARESKD